MYDSVVKTCTYPSKYKGGDIVTIRSNPRSGRKIEIERDARLLKFHYTIGSFECWEMKFLKDGSIYNSFIYLES